MLNISLHFGKSNVVKDTYNNCKNLPSKNYNYINIKDFGENSMDRKKEIGIDRGKMNMLCINFVSF